MPGVRSGHREFRGPQFRVLCQEQLDDIHSATLEVMERTGCRIFEDEAVALLRKAGAHVSDGNWVRIPPGLVEKALSTVPKRVVLCDREGRRVMPLEKRNSFYGPGSDCLNVRDSRTGERRKAAVQDVVDGMRVCEAMPNIDFVMSMFMPWEVPNEVADRYQMEAMLLYTRKPIVFVTWDLPGCVDAVAMAAAVAGGMDELRLRPQAACYVNVATPLRHNQEAVQKLLYMAERGLPVLYIPGLLRGTTGPMTVAGAMVLSNACQLTGLVLSQIKREGAPFIRGGGGSTLDMRTMSIAYASPERTRAAFDLAHYYDLPAFGFGGCSDSKLLDEQAAIEAATSLVLESLAGANLIHDVGYLESGLTGSLELLVMCDEIIGWIKRNMQPLAIDEETVPLDLIDEIGPDGHFFETDHTMRHFREDWYPHLMDRSGYDEWVSLGKPIMREKAHERVLEIIAPPAVPLVSAEVAAQVRAVRDTGNRQA